MADKDGDGPSLELPSLGFGRKRGKKARATADDAPAAEETTPETGAGTGSGPEGAPTDTTLTSTPEPAPVAPELEGDPAASAVPEEHVPDPATETAVVEAQPETQPEPQPQPEPETVTAPVAAAHQPEPEPTPPPLFVDEVEDRPTRTDAAPVSDEADATEPDAEPKPKREFHLPQVSEMTASLLTGAVVGLLMVGLTGAGFRLCEVIQGAPSCGKPGFLLLLAIVVTVILVGRALLAAWSVPDPGSTSFLAVGLLSVVALLFLVEVLFDWWMIIVIPVLSMVCFALSSWVATVFVESDD